MSDDLYKLYNGPIKYLNRYSDKYRCIEVIWNFEAINCAHLHWLFTIMMSFTYNPSPQEPKPYTWRTGHCMNDAKWTTFNKIKAGNWSAFLRAVVTSGITKQAGTSSYCHIFTHHQTIRINTLLISQNDNACSSSEDIFFLWMSEAHSNPQ